MGVGYERRVVDDELDELLPGLPAISLEGAKAVGKTETATRRARVVHRLDDPTTRQLFEADPSRMTTGAPPILLDEWQRHPASWDAVRRAVDVDATPGRFLLTGSAAPVEAPTHTGAGRIVTLRMRPMSLAERGLGPPTVSLRRLLQGGAGRIEGHTSSGLRDYVGELLRSGFPGLRQRSGRALRAQLEGYLSRIAERDFEQQGLRVKRPASLRRWMTAYAAATATTATYETIRDASTSGEGNKPARTTTQPYRDVLEQLWIVEPLPAWRPARGRIARLTAPPKHHLVDPALATTLLGLDSEALLSASPRRGLVPREGSLLGGLFESLVTQSVRVYAQAAEARVQHLRTSGGAREVDLIVESAAGSVIACEVKLSPTVHDSDLRHLKWLRAELGDRLLDSLVITTGPDAYRRPDGIAVVPAALLGP
jgi:predicted AAA+ superfamily ATPase